ncbi:protein phosphatase 1 regulatory subunit 32-like [Gigantopelta aegis]|uniref:protein phosphatase 1 regulatory subunit 32-like n=1 Tax=Gigantopelta aegis TaxID=1735272 RepID=UPI001B88BAEC|nr:protein phosphatase 1 regulatory subunit 32-like [Gigantopelta aegis]
MRPMPTGPKNPHIQASHGPDTNLMKFYITQNSTTYGKYWDKFKPRQGRHTGTGYSANFRPAVYYSKRLDNLDNPVMSQICAQNYHTMTELDFQRYRENTGSEVLPFHVKQVDTGFVQGKPVTIPLEKEVKGVFINTRVASAPSDILPRGRPRLETLQPKNPIDLENNAYGPSYMSTETKEKFKSPVATSMPSYKIVCPKEDTGFTQAYNIEPITFNPNQTHSGETPSWMTTRPTGISIMKSHFIPYENPSGNDPLPNPAHGSSHKSGFTREKPKPIYLQKMSTAYDHEDQMPPGRLDYLKKNDPADYLNVIHPNNYSSVSKNHNRGLQRPELSEADRLSRTAVGMKELSGYSANTDKFVQVDDDRRRFITHYMTRFKDKTPYGMDREGHCRHGIQQLLPDGFTKSTLMHSLGLDVNTTDTLQRLEPYVARSIKKRDVFYDDHTYDYKMHPSPLAAV